MASDAPTLCPELRFWVDPLPVSVLGPPASCPVFLPSEQTPGSAQASWGLPASGQGEGVGLCSITRQAVLPSPVCLCNYFCKNCLICGCHSLGPSLRPNLSSRPACTSLCCSGVSQCQSSPAARPGQQRPVTQQPAQSTSLWGRGGELLSRRFEPRAWGKDPT